MEKTQSLAEPTTNAARKAWSVWAWGLPSLAVVVFIGCLPLMARGATLEVTAGGSPSPPMIQFSDASGNLAATLTGSVTLASRPPLIL